jgi:hypothetical protein
MLSAIRLKSLSVKIILIGIFSTCLIFIPKYIDPLAIVTYSFVAIVVNHRIPLWSPFLCLSSTFLIESNIIL